MAGLMNGKPVLLGMNSPQSDDPAMALFPWDGRAAGGRLLGMIQDAAEASTPGFFFPPQMYLEVFDRRNMLNQKSWDPVKARARAPEIYEELSGRTVVICGLQVLRALTLRRHEWMVWNAHPSDLFKRLEVPFTYCVIPHPSGLSRDYNDPAKKIAVGTFLMRLAAEYIGAQPRSVE